MSFARQAFFSINISIWCKIVLWMMNFLLFSVVVNNKSGHKSVCLQCHNEDCLLCRLWCWTMIRVVLFMQKLSQQCLVSMAMSVYPPRVENVQEQSGLMSPEGWALRGCVSCETLVWSPSCEPWVVECEGKRLWPTVKTVREGLILKNMSNRLCNCCPFPGMRPTRQ